MKKIIIVISIFFIISCNKENTSKNTIPENETSINFETVAKGYVMYNYIGLNTSKDRCFIFSNDLDWKNFIREKGLNLLFSKNDSIINNISFANHDIVVFIPESSSDYLSVDILKIKENDTAYNVYYTNLGMTDALLLNTFYQIVKTKKLNTEKKVICIKQY